jgi:C4-dicarboxylate-specific signal transduction histidine kinase
MRPASAEVAEVVSDAIALLRPQKEWRNVEVTVDVAAHLEVALSPQRLTQVLLNLLLNAAAALSETRSERSHTIVVRGRLEGARARIEVEDDGPGVPKEMRERIFDPFVTTKEVGAGTGLGLSVCRGIIEGASGRIFVDGAYERGARFVVELPAVASGSE